MPINQLMLEDRPLPKGLKLNPDQFLCVQSDVFRNWWPFATTMHGLTLDLLEDNGKIAAGNAIADDYLDGDDKKLLSDQRAAFLKEPTLHKAMEALYQHALKDAHERLNIPL